MTRAPGMVDVARVAGVSHITVSRVLNDHPSVRAETRERVQAAIEQLGYRRNSVARALKSRRSSTIGVVIAGSELFELPQILLGVESSARTAGYWVNLASWQSGNAHDLTETVQRLADQSVEAVAVIADRPVAVDALTSMTTGVPTSVVMSGDLPNPDIASVELDQQLGARLATRHLIGLGHRRLTHLSGALRTYDARARVQGWQSELATSADLHIETLEGDFTAESGFALAEQLILRDEELPTAIFAGNDQMAMGALAAFAKHGISVPRDVSLVGFDDIAGVGYLVPALTTVRQDFRTLGSEAIEVLLAMLKGGQAAHRRIAPSLILRSSTAPPRPTTSAD